MLVRLSPVWLSASVRLGSKRCWCGGELWLDDWLWLRVSLLGGERWLGDWLWLGCGRCGCECACGRGVRSQSGVACAASLCSDLPQPKLVLRADNAELEGKAA